MDEEKINFLIDVDFKLIILFLSVLEECSYILYLLFLTKSRQYSRSTPYF